jgi:hypothetical protein
MMPGSELVWGVVGWEDDASDGLDLGDSDNDGANLVKVQVFRGRDPGKAIDAAQAQGQRLLCQLADHVRLPAKGTRVMVAIPESYGIIPGGSLIVGCASNNWQAQANAGAGELVIQVPGSPAAIFLRANGTIVLKTADPKGNTSVVKFAPGLFQVQDPLFQINCDSSGVRLRHYAGATLNLGAIGLPGPLSSLSTMATLKAGRVRVDGSLVTIGPHLPGNVFLPAAYGPDPSPAPLALLGATSAAVKLSP